MTTHRYRVHREVDINKLFEEYRKNGFFISNPDCKTGKSFDVIVRGNQKIAGFDVLLDKTPPLGLIYGNTNKRAGRFVRSKTGSGIRRHYNCGKFSN